MDIEHNPYCRLDCLVHLSPRSVTNTVAYQQWMSSFPSLVTGKKTRAMSSLCLSGTILSIHVMFFFCCSLCILTLLLGVHISLCPCRTSLFVSGGQSVTHLMLGSGNCHSQLHHSFIAATRYVNMLHLVCPDLFAAQVTQ